MELDSVGILGVYSAALVLGMMHALEPGHGKTVVAAYLVGSRGRNLDALLLGIVVTFTHSFSIIILGVLAKVSSRYFTDQALHAYLGLVASVLILGIGLWMLKTRWAALRNPSTVHHHGPLSHSHSHHHNHSHHNDNHHHDNQNAQHIHHKDKAPGLLGLIFLGISGGIVPCPAALAILLASASVGDIGKGLALVIIFSIGLAFALITIGLVVVNSVRFAQRFLDTKKFMAKISFASAGIITMIGVFTLYSSLRHLGNV